MPNVTNEDVRSYKKNQPITMHNIYGDTMSFST